MVTGPDGELLICYHGRTEKTGNARIGFISPAEITDTCQLRIRQNGRVTPGLLRRVGGEY